MKFRPLVLLLATGIISAAAGEALAGCGGYGYGTPYGGYYSYLVNRVHTDRQIPYFAEHPPVYYSGIVPRTYGQSPFAYPACGCDTIASTPVEPLMVPNPHFDDSNDAEAPAEETASQVKSQASGPQVTENPFFASEAQVVQVSSTH